MAEAGDGQFKSHQHKHQFRLGLLDGHYFRCLNVYNVSSTDLLFVFKNKKDKGVIKWTLNQC